LSSRVEDRDLEEAFGKYGKIEKAQIMRDPHSRESRGFGFVTMEQVADADAAIAALNGTELLGRAIVVEKARRARARTPTPGQYHGPPKRDYHNRPYQPRGYDDRRGGRYDDRYDDRRGGGYDRDRYDDRRGGYDRHDDRRHDDRDRRGYDDRRGSYDDRRGYDDRRSHGAPTTMATPMAARRP